MAIFTGNAPKEMDGGECTEHHKAFAPRVHPEINRKGSELMPEHQRGVGHPAHHSKGKFPSQLQPDHGPHKGAGKHK